MCIFCMEITYVLVNCDLGSEEAVIEDLRHMESVKEIHDTFGTYDIVVKIENPKKEKLRDTITMNIRKLAHVRSTLTLMGIPEQN